jgi:hypothetical protein
MNPFRFLISQLACAIIFLLTSLSQYVNAQVSYEAMNHELRNFNSIPRSTDGSKGSMESSLRPNLISDVAGESRASYRTYLPTDSYDSSIFANRKYKEYSWFRRKLLYENFIIIDTGKVYITIDPLFNLSRGGGNWGFRNPKNTTSNQETLKNNTRGLLVQMDIGEKLSLVSYAYENQSEFPQYINGYVDTYDVVPGQGRVKGFKETGYDYSMAGGYVSYKVIDALNIQFGHHKHFVGDGHRSLILSDNSFNYPFLRFNTKFFKGKIRYSVMYSSYQDLVRSQSAALNEGVFKKKSATLHYLEYSFSSKLRFYLAQNTIWNDFVDDELTNNLASWNPLIFVNPALNGLDDKHNSLLGFGFKVNPIQRLELYGQVVVDDDAAEQTGLQMGGKVFVSNTTYLQLEGNWIAPFTYSETYLSVRNNDTEKQASNAFVHYNQPLAHVLGNDFDEIVFKAGHRYKRVLAELQINYFYSRGFAPYVPTKGIWANLELAYLLNPATNLKVFAAFTRRSTESSNTSDEFITMLFNFGIKTDLRNIYYDF